MRNKIVLALISAGLFVSLPIFVFGIVCFVISLIVGSKWLWQYFLAMMGGGFFTYFLCYVADFHWAHRKKDLLQNK